MGIESMKISIKGKELVLRIPIAGKGELSTSKKSMVLNTTKGFKILEGIKTNNKAISLNLNIIQAK